jgi:hypothetical protein
VIISAKVSDAFIKICIFFSTAVCVAPEKNGAAITDSNINPTANVVLTGKSGENFSKAFKDLTSDDMIQMMEKGYCKATRNKRDAGDKTVDRATQKNLPPPRVTQATTTKASGKTSGGVSAGGSGGEGYGYPAPDIPFLTPNDGYLPPGDEYLPPLKKLRRY